MEDWFCICFNIHISYVNEQHRNTNLNHYVLIWDKKIANDNKSRIFFLEHFTVTRLSNVDKCESVTEHQFCVYISTVRSTVDSYRTQTEQQLKHKPNRIWQHICRVCGMVKIQYHNPNQTHDVNSLNKQSSYSKQ